MRTLSHGFCRSRHDVRPTILQPQFPSARPIVRPSVHTMLLLLFVCAINAGYTNMPHNVQTLGCIVHVTVIILHTQRRREKKTLSRKSIKSYNTPVGLGARIAGNKICDNVCGLLLLLLGCRVSLCMGGLCWVTQIITYKLNIVYSRCTHTVSCV